MGPKRVPERTFPLSTVRVRQHRGRDEGGLENFKSLGTGVIPDVRLALVGQTVKRTGDDGEVLHVPVVVRCKSQEASQVADVGGERLVANSSDLSRIGGYAIGSHYVPQERSFPLEQLAFLQVQAQPGLADGGKDFPQVAEGPLEVAGVDEVVQVDDADAGSGNVSLDTVSGRCRY
ncbi:hypothetical protein AAFF_G00014040 [Aldrovandia affinis]|uniref:Uncharacterized protein n=1 Tax=Aldrovandia affinis TaxID=143900 RepID=A0AAD7S6B1_9TELE|nr:hypothetical protein AAFF_G00014040 [Aldrovandia affinis]